MPSRHVLALPHLVPVIREGKGREGKGRMLPGLRDIFRASGKREESRSETAVRCEHALPASGGAKIERARLPPGPGRLRGPWGGGFLPKRVRHPLKVASGRGEDGLHPSREGAPMTKEAPGQEAPQ